MKRVLKYCFRTHFLQVSGMIAGFALIILVLNMIFPPEIIDGQSASSGTFNSLYSGFPMMCAIMQTIGAVQCCGIHFNVALTMGAKRRDYAVAIHLCMIVETIVSMILIHLLWWLNMKMHLLGRFSEYFYTPDKFSLMLFFLVCGQMTGLGCMTIGNYKRIVGSLFMGFVTMGYVMAFTFMMVVSDSLYLWGDLPTILPVVMAVVAVAGETGYWLYIRKATVK